jgi:hypothetical protein
VTRGRPQPTWTSDQLGLRATFASFDRELLRRRHKSSGHGTETIKSPIGSGATTWVPSARSRRRSRSRTTCPLASRSCGHPAPVPALPSGTSGRPSTRLAELVVARDPQALDATSNVSPVSGNLSVPVV